MERDTERQVTCQGCGTATTAAFQCPLCQAEGTTECGFFCSQECFARNWLEHRNTLHKSGVVRERRPVVEATSGEHNSTKKRNKRARAAGFDDNEVDNAEVRSESVKAAMVFPPWPVLPSAVECAKHHWATVTPQLPLEVPRAVVRPAAVIAKTAEKAAKMEAKHYFWSALLSAAQYTMSSVTANPSLQVLVVAGDVYSASAFAWAARCAGLTGMLQLAVANRSSKDSNTSSGEKEGEMESAEELRCRLPSKYFTSHKRVVIATSTVVRDAALRSSKASTAASGAAALWLTGKPEHSLLLTLPDVVEPADLQGVQTRAVFFTGPDGTGEEEEEVDVEGTESVGYTYSNVEANYEDGSTLLWRPVTLLAPGTSTANSTTTATTTNGNENVLHDEGTAENARQLTPQHEPAARLDDEISTSFANGDVGGALHHLVHYYQRLPGHFESSLFYLLCCNWGAVNAVHAHHRLAYVARFFVGQSARFDAKKNAALADAALRAVAAVVRLLPRMRDDVAEAAAAAATTTDGKGGRKKKARKTDVGDTPSSVVLPTLATTTRPTLPIDGVSTPSSVEVARLANYYTYLPNLQLQATVCHLYAAASAAVLDTFAHAWGLYRYLPGPASLAEVEKARSAAVLRVRQRYSTKLGAANADFYVTLMQLVYDAVGPYSLSLDEVSRRLQWDLTLAHDAGSLESFLQCCALLPNAAGMLLPTAKKQKVRKAAETSRSASSFSPSSEGNNDGDGESSGNIIRGNVVRSLSSRQPASKLQRETPQSRIEKLRCFAVKTTAGSSAGKQYGFLELPWKSFPITGERQRQVNRLHKSAVEEILMAMPRVPRPLYIGDVGNLIGKWAHFNARFEGVLGATLQVFLEAHPEAFRVLDRLVTRRTAGTTEQVRIRFDAEDDQDHGSSDDENTNSSRSRKNIDRQLLTGQKGKTAVELPARARKKRAMKAFNKERFNRNYKSIDPSARVPGYVKRSPRRIKGRGKKANKRVVKRGS